MKRILAAAALTLAALIPAAANAQGLGGGGSSGLATDYHCAADPGKSCTYKVTVNGFFGFKINCTDADAKKAPEVRISGKDSSTSCTVRTDDSYAYGSCSVEGVPGDPDSIRIIAACQAKDTENIF